MAPFGTRVRFAGAVPHARSAGALRGGGPLPLARDQRSLRHGLSRSPGGRPARGRRPHRRRARGRGRRRHRPADADRRCCVLCGRRGAAARSTGTSARVWAPRRPRAWPLITTNAPPPMHLAAALRDLAAMSGVPFALLRHAPTELERPAAGCRDSPTPVSAPRARRRRGNWRLPPPAAGWKRVSSPLQRARRTAELVQPSDAGRSSTHACAR